MQLASLRSGPEQWRLRSSTMQSLLFVLVAVLVVAGVVAAVLTPADAGATWLRSPVIRGAVLVVVMLFSGGAIVQLGMMRSRLRRIRRYRPEAVAFPSSAMTGQLRQILALQTGRTPSRFGRLPVVVATATGLEVWWRDRDVPELTIPWRGVQMRAAGVSMFTGARWNVIQFAIPGWRQPLELPVGPVRDRALELWGAATTGIAAAAREPTL